MLPYFVVSVSARAANPSSRGLQVLEVEERQLFLVGDLEGDVEHAFLRVVEIHEA